MQAQDSQQLWLRRGSQPCIQRPTLIRAGSAGCPAAPRAWGPLFAVSAGREQPLEACSAPLSHPGPRPAVPRGYAGSQTLRPRGSPLWACFTARALLPGEPLRPSSQVSAQRPLLLPTDQETRGSFGANVYCTVASLWTAAVTLLGDIYIYTYVHTLPTPTAETTPTVLERTVKI